MTYDVNRKIPTGQELTNRVTELKLSEALARIQQLEGAVQYLSIEVNNANTAIQSLQEEIVILAERIQKVSNRGIIYGGQKTVGW